jgi:hypothetical protein
MPSDDDEVLRERIADTLDRLGLEELTADYRDEHRAAEDALAARFDPLADALAEVPEVAEVNRVNVHRDGEDILVPVVPVLFEDAGVPDLDVVWDVVGEALRAVAPEFSDHHVRHYDLQFAYADADEESVVYRRITVQPDLVERYRHGDLDLAGLREAVAAGDDGDDGVPPVNWQRFDAEHASGSGAYSGNTAAVAAACAASSAGAAAACSSAAGAAAGAGGSC